MGRPGGRVARRKHCTSRVGAPHKVTKEQSQQWFKQRFDGILLGVRLLPFISSVSSH